MQFNLFKYKSHDIQLTTFQCTFKTDVLTDRSEASMRVTLEDGRAIFFKLANLNILVIY